jgi:formate hydrogenlyase transcriptional activator
VLRVTLSNLGTDGGLVSEQSQHAKPDNKGNLRRFLEQTERQRILEALDETRWVIAGPKGAAAHLGVKRSTLQARILKLGIARNR